MTNCIGLPIELSAKDSPSLTNGSRIRWGCPRIGKPTTSWLPEESNRESLSVIRPLVHRCDQARSSSLRQLRTHNYAQLTVAFPAPNGNMLITNGLKTSG